jgi:tRNA-splicing ligase RtcB
MRELDLENEKRKLDKQGIIHGMESRKHLDEAPSAYKNIDVVMNNQKDLVKIFVELQPLAVVKG